jgi:hypothetical protein
MRVWGSSGVPSHSFAGVVEGKLCNGTGTWQVERNYGLGRAGVDSLMLCFVWLYHAQVKIATVSIVGVPELSCTSLEEHGRLIRLESTRYFQLGSLIDLLPAMLRTDPERKVLWYAEALYVNIARFDAG